MLRTVDGKITIDVVQTLGDAVMPAADFSILNIPEGKESARSMFLNLYNSPTQRHVSLILNRHSRKLKLQGFENIAESSKTGAKTGLEFLDQIHLWYEKPSTSSNIGFLPVAEEGYLFYKGDAPNTKNTSWFSDGNPNATNHWALTPAEYEGRTATYYRKFAWEIGLLLYTMCEPVEHKRMVYGLDDDPEHVLKFAKTYDIQVHFLVSTEVAAKNILSRYEVT